MRETAAEQKRTQANLVEHLTRREAHDLHDARQLLYLVLAREERVALRREARSSATRCPTIPTAVHREHDVRGE